MAQQRGAAESALGFDGVLPAVWKRDSSFVAVMEELYQRVREKNRDLL